MNLEKKIKALQKDIKSSIDNINKGGCIHFAYFLSKKLSFLKIPHKVVLIDRSQKIDIRNNFFVGANHAFVFIDGIGYVDGEETCKSYVTNWYPYKRSFKSVKKLDYFRNMPDIWSDIYDTEDNFLLEDLINKHIYI
jgi:hypothetical protein